MPIAAHYVTELNFHENQAMERRFYSSHRDVGTSLSSHFGYRVLNGRPSRHPARDHAGVDGRPVFTLSQWVLQHLLDPLNPPTTVLSSTTPVPRRLQTSFRKGGPWSNTISNKATRFGDQIKINSYVRTVLLPNAPAPGWVVISLHCRPLMVHLSNSDAQAIYHLFYYMGQLAKGVNTTIAESRIETAVALLEKMDKWDPPAGASHPDYRQTTIGQAVGIKFALSNESYLFMPLEPTKDVTYTIINAWVNSTSGSNDFRALVPLFAFHPVGDHVHLSVRRPGNATDMSNNMHRLTPDWIPVSPTGVRDALHLGSIYLSPRIAYEYGLTLANHMLRLSATTSTAHATLVAKGKLYTRDRWASYGASPPLNVDSAEMALSFIRYPLRAATTPVSYVDDLWFTKSIRNFLLNPRIQIQDVPYLGMFHLRGAGSLFRQQTLDQVRMDQSASRVMMPDPTYPLTALTSLPTAKDLALDMSQRHLVPSTALTLPLTNYTPANQQIQVYDESKDYGD